MWKSACVGRVGVLKRTSVERVSACIRVGTCVEEVVC